MTFPSLIAEPILREGRKADITFLLISYTLPVPLRLGIMSVDCKNVSLDVQCAVSARPTRLLSWS